LPQSEVSSNLRPVERVPLGGAGGVNGPMVAALARVGQLPTAYAFANHFTANSSITVVALSFGETVDSTRLGALRSRPG
jgi:hypothetical protein